MSISKHQRALIVVNHLASGETDYLYRFIENAGRATIDTILGDDYGTVVKLYDRNATVTKFISALQTQGARSTIKRIDVLLMVHGEDGIIAFKGSTNTSRDVRDLITPLKIGHKLRLLYSTCCFGDTHSADFIAAGFDAAIGSKKVNANAAVEFGPLLGLWQFNVKLSDCLAPTLPPTPAADAAAKAYGRAHNTSWKNKVNSTKVIRGNRSLKISS